MATQSLKTRLWLNTGILLVLLITIGGVGIHTASLSHHAFKEYKVYGQIQDQLNEIADYIGGLRAEIGVYLGTDNDKILNEILNDKKRLDGHIANVDSFLEREIDKTEFAVLKKTIADYMQNVEKLREASDRKQFMLEVLGPAGAKIPADTMLFYDRLVEESNLEGERVIKDNEVAIILIIALTVVCVVFGSVFSAAISGNIVKTIRNVIDGLGVASQSVGSAANQIAASSQSLAEASSEQAATVEETSASMEEISSMVKTNAASVDQVRDRANKANQTAQLGSQKMKELEGKLSLIRNSGTALKAAMAEISKSSKEVAVVASTINEIAFQTNLLSLNAAVEAARAGEAGAGFAVVAGEVGSLAQRSASNASETTKLISQAAESSKAGVNASDDVIKNLNEATKLFDEVTKAFEQIVGQVADVSVHTEEVRQSSVQQTSGVEQVNTAISQLDQVVQQNAATSEEAAGAASQLTAQSDQVRRYVEQLKEIVYGSKGLIDFQPPTAHNTPRMFPDATRATNSNSGTTVVRSARLAFKGADSLKKTIK